jgi:methyl-accepting chemotaxis protein
VSVAVPILGLSLFVWLRANHNNKVTADALRELADEHVARATLSVADLAKLANAQLHEQTRLQLSVATELLTLSGGVTERRTAQVNWRAEHPVTKETRTVALPELSIGDERITLLAEGAPSPFVDEVSRVIGGASTLLQRLNDEGEMLRVATTVRTAEGRRAVGTYLPAVVDGNPNPVVAALKRGESYIGRANVVGQWMSTGYSPLKDPEGRVIGAVFVGLPEEKAFRTIQSSVAGFQVSPHSSVLVLNSQGQVLISTKGERDGRVLLADSSSPEAKLYGEIIRDARGLPEGETRLIRYLMKQANGAEELHYARYMHFSPFDWTIIFSLPETEAQALAIQLHEQQHQDMNVQLALAGGVLLLAIALWLWLGAKISRRIEEVAAAIHDEAQQTSEVSSHVAQASETLAEGATQQAAALEETSASIEEITSMTKKNADNAAGAQRLAAATRSAAEGATTAMSEMKVAMKLIEDTSADIAKTLRSIDEIAFQTNILALNAAVEAARAGGAGAGFAVVAEEVRALAQRCAAAAKETAIRIEASVGASAQGVAICGRVDGSLGTIVGHAREMDTLVAEISTSSREQSIGLQQSSTAIGQLDRNTQANAASAQQCSSAAIELAAQAKKQLVSADELAAIVRGSQHEAPVPVMSTDAPTPSRAHRSRASVVESVAA